ncbi:uncharacterized protein LOC142476927 isoform X5 [Ascaphus truei]|uniref:uncharacterized protein LOC142476927 isoform X5 n=1 Tax=Ascaphus truei TaxID=8439 RepID=UPI003F593BB7
METGGIGASRGRRKGEGGRCRSLAPGKEEKAGKWGRTSDAVRDNMGTVKGSVDTGKETPRRRFAPPATKAVRFPERGGKSGDAGREEEEEVVAGERGAELEKRTGAAIEKKKREDRGSLSDAQYEEIFEVVLGRSSLAAPEVTSGNAERAAGRVLTSATNGGNAKHRLKRSVPRRGKVT